MFLPGATLSTPGLDNALLLLLLLLLRTQLKYEHVKHTMQNASFYIPVAQYQMLYNLS
jgi:hypothetical protein